MRKPTIKQIAWVFEHISNHINEGGTFRYLIYNRLNLKPEAYSQLYSAGGMHITNMICDYQTFLKQKEVNNAINTGND